MNTRRTCQLSCAVLLTAFVPTLPAQELSRASLLNFVNTRYQAYFHWNMCTFKNASSDQHHGRSSGKEPPTMWAPTGLDCEQWARVCVENRIAGNGAMEQASITEVEEGPWWKVDLQRDCRIDRIEIFNRTDDGSESLKEFRVTVLDSEGAAVWEHHQGAAPERVLSLDVHSVSGRFVEIRLDGHGTLSLAEVIVLGEIL